MMKKLLFASFLSLALIQIGHAGEFARDALVSQIQPMRERPDNPTNQNAIKIYVDNQPWGTSTCRRDAVILQRSDRDLLAVLIAGWSAGKKITIGVTDTIKPTDDDSCQVTWLSIRD